MNVGLPDLSKKSYVFSQITFFRKIRETNVHSKGFYKFDSAQFGNRPMLKKRKYFFEFFD